jgi:SAM-dependent methyltransferase
VEQQSIAFDRIADRYDATRGGMERGRRVGALLAELLPAAGPLLEVGVGTGLISAGLGERGRTPVGVDLSLPMLAVARDRLPGRVAAGDAHRLPVRTGAVAGAYAVHVLHLVGSIPATLAELARVLRPGGTLVVSAYPAGEHGDLGAEFARTRAAMGGEQRRDDIDLVRELAAAAGFTPGDQRQEDGRSATPAEAAETLATRSLSWMWSIDDATWDRELPLALARLRALPHQDTPRPGPGHTLIAFHRP